MDEQTRSALASLIQSGQIRDQNAVREIQQYINSGGRFALSPATAQLVRMRGIALPGDNLPQVASEQVRQIALNGPQPARVGDDPTGGSAPPLPGMSFQRQDAVPSNGAPATPRPAPANPITYRPPSTGVNLGSSSTPTVTPPVTAGSPGATPPGGPAGGQQGQFAQNAILAPDINGNTKDQKETMLQMLMERMGVSMQDPGLYGGVIASKINEYLPYFYDLLGLQGQTNSPVALNNLYTGGLDQLVNMVGSNTFFSGMQDFAGKSRDTLMGALPRLRDVGQQQNYLNNILALLTAGQNPLLRQASADDATRAWLGYRSENFNKPPGTPGAPTSYIDWLLGQNDPRYGAVLNLLGGGR